MRRLFALLVPAAVLLLTLSLVTGCTDNPTSTISPGQPNIAFKASVSDAEYLQLVDVFVLTVTGRDMDPIVDTLFFDGRYISGEVNVPAGDNRLFVLEGYQLTPNAAPGFRLIYRGQTTTSVRPDAVTQLPIAMIPVVPMVKLSPVATTVPSGSTFSMDLKIYNVKTLVALFVWIEYDNTYITPDGATPAPGLDPSVVFRAGRANTDAPLYEVYVSDTLRTGIVDANGNATLGTINFSTNGIIGAPIATPLTFNLVVTTVQYPDSLGTLEGVFREESQVTLNPITDRSVSFVDSRLFGEVQYQVSLYDSTIYSRQMMLSDVLPITYLSVVEYGVQDLGGIENLINLNYFAASYCNITDFTPLAALPNLRYFEVEGNKLTDISTLAGAKQLEYLDLSYNALANIGPVENLTNLTYLNMRSNRVSDLLPLLRNSNHGGFGSGDTIDITGNPLDPAAAEIIDTLTARGVYIINAPQ